MVMKAFMCSSPVPWSVSIISTRTSPCTSSCLVAAVSGNHLSSPTVSQFIVLLHTQLREREREGLPRGELMMLSLSSITFPRGSLDLHTHTTHTTHTHTPAVCIGTLNVLPCNPLTLQGMFTNNSQHHFQFQNTHRGHVTVT